MALKYIARVTTYSGPIRHYLIEFSLNLQSGLCDDSDKTDNLPKVTPPAEMGPCWFQQPMLPPLVVSVLSPQTQPCKTSTLVRRGSCLCQLLTGRGDCVGSLCGSPFQGKLHSAHIRDLKGWQTQGRAGWINRERLTHGPSNLAGRSLGRPQRQGATVLSSHPEQRWLNLMHCQAQRGNVRNVINSQCTGSDSRPGKRLPHPLRCPVSMESDCPVSSSRNPAWLTPLRAPRIVSGRGLDWKHSKGWLNAQVTQGGLPHSREGGFGSPWASTCESARECPRAQPGPTQSQQT